MLNVSLLPINYLPVYDFIEQEQLRGFEIAFFFFFFILHRGHTSDFVASYLKMLFPWKRCCDCVNLTLVLTSLGSYLYLYIYILKNITEIPYPHTSGKEEIGEER